MARRGKLDRKARLARLADGGKAYELRSHPHRARVQAQPFRMGELIPVEQGVMDVRYGVPGRQWRRLVPILGLWESFGDPLVAVRGGGDRDVGARCAAFLEADKFPAVEDAFQAVQDRIALDERDGPSGLA